MMIIYLFYFTIFSYKWGRGKWKEIEIEKNAKIRYNGVLKGMVKSNVENILSYWNN